jgi:hypothetical protein
MSDRREFRRIPGSALSWLTAFTARSPVLELLDVSDGGALIETPTRWQPGEREVFVLQGNRSVRVAAWVLRAEVTRLSPTLLYRSAIRFAAPLPLSSLGRTDAGLVMDTSREVREEFLRVVLGLSGVQTVRISASVTTQRGAEPVHFTVPNSEHGDQRLLQIFFAPSMTPTAEQFDQLRHLAVLASGLPDVHLVRAGNRFVTAENAEVVGTVGSVTGGPR